MHFIPVRLAMHPKTIFLVAALSLKGGVISIPISQRTAAPERVMDVRELLASARGVAPALCALASDGASNGGWGWDAPDVAIQSDIRATIRDLRNAELDDAQGKALLDALASDDACVRHLAGTLIGRSRDKS